MDVQQWARDITAAVERVIYGKAAVIERLLVALLAGGHVLLEDVPGVGKTILARALSVSLGGEFRRIQCTPDLLPADVLGVSVYNPHSGAFDFREGPVNTNLLLVDEINRATPRTQSALLEAMSERQVSIEGTTRPLPAPFFLIATENPVEFEGTFSLPQAQRDRFFLTAAMGYPDQAAEAEILVSQARLSHPVSDLEPVTDVDTVVELQRQIVSIDVPVEVEDYILAIVAATRADRRLELGASPRAVMALYSGAQALTAIRGRESARVEDVRELAEPILLKRIAIRSEQLLRGVTESDVVAGIVDDVPMPESL